MLVVGVTTRTAPRRIRDAAVYLTQVLGLQQRWRIVGRIHHVTRQRRGRTLEGVRPVYWAARRVLSSHLREGADRWNAAAAERMEEDVVDKVMVEGGVCRSQGAQSVSTLMLISFQLSSSSFELQ
jgi:hypothetical protein